MDNHNTDECLGIDRKVYLTLFLTDRLRIVVYELGILCNICVIGKRTVISNLEGSCLTIPVLSNDELGDLNGSSTLVVYKVLLLLLFCKLLLSVKEAYNVSILLNGSGVTKVR